MFEIIKNLLISMMGSLLTAGIIKAIKLLIERHKK